MPFHLDKLSFISALLFPLIMQSQSEELTNAFKFREGIYMNYAEFETNSPSISLDSCKIWLTANSNHDTKFIKKIKYIGETGADTIKLKFKKIWGLSMNGEAYINYRGHFTDVGTNIGKNMNMNMVNPDCVSFSRIRRIGSICTFSVENDDGSETREKILKFNTGEIKTLNATNLQQFISDDMMLSIRYKNERKKRKMARTYIALYNQKNKVYIEE